MQRIALLLLACAACTTARELQRPLNAADIRQLNDAMRDKDVDVAYYANVGGAIDSVTDEATNVHLAPDKARFDVEAVRREVPILALRSLQYLGGSEHPRLRGAAESLWFGAPLALGGLAIGLSAHFTCGTNDTCTNETVAPIVAGAVLGLLVTPLIGALIGHHEVVTFR